MFKCSFCVFLTLLLLYQDPDGSYNKSQDSNVACPQIYYTSPVGQEDCLFLNVYVPEKVFTEGISEYLPVMAWIHGGALEVGWNSFSSSGWFSVGICKYKPGYKSHDLLSSTAFIG